MTRAETIAQVVGVTKQMLTDATDFIELWVINELLDDEYHRELLANNPVNQKLSVVRIDQSQFGQLNVPHGIYKERHLKLNYGSRIVYLNTDAVFRIAIPTLKIDIVNSRLEGGKYALSSTEGYATLNVSDASQSKYFQEV